MEWITKECPQLAAHKRKGIEHEAHEWIDGKDADYWCPGRDGTMRHVHVTIDTGP